MAIKNVVLSDNQTGDKIYPRTSYDNLDNIPSDLLTYDYLNVGATDTQLPTLGPNVNSLSNWSSRTINLNGFKLYFFSGYFNVKKDMFLNQSANWHSDKQVLFFLSKEILADTNIQMMKGFLNNSLSQDFLIFRTFSDINSVSWETFDQTADPTKFPDNFNIYINGMINSKI